MLASTHPEVVAAVLQADTLDPKRHRAWAAALDADTARAGLRSLPIDARDCRIANAVVAPLMASKDPAVRFETLSRLRWTHDPYRRWLTRLVRAYPFDGTLGDDDRVMRRLAGNDHIRGPLADAAVSMSGHAGLRFAVALALASPSSDVVDVVVRAISGWVNDGAPDGTATREPVAALLLQVLRRRGEFESSTVATARAAAVGLVDNGTQDASMSELQGRLAELQADDDAAAQALAGGNVPSPVDEMTPETRELLAAHADLRPASAFALVEEDPALLPAVIAGRCDDWLAEFATETARRVRHRVPLRKALAAAVAAMSAPAAAQWCGGFVSENPDLVKLLIEAGVLNDRLLRDLPLRPLLAAVVDPVVAAACHTPVQSTLGDNDEAWQLFEGVADESDVTFGALLDAAAALAAPRPAR